MNEEKFYLTNNECYKVAGKRIENRGVLIHDTATVGAKVENFLKSWNTSRPGGRQVCVHAFADNKHVVNILPYNYKCWGCGEGDKGSGNNYYIQLEMCLPENVYFENGWKYKSKDYTSDKKYMTEMLNVVAEWSANRLYELGINKIDKNTVTSHYEAYMNGLASNHSDPKGLLDLFGFTMDDIRTKIAEHLRKLISKEENIKVQENKKEYNIVKGDIVKLLTNAVQYDGNKIKEDYKNKIYTVKEINEQGRTVLTIDNIVIYAVDVKYLEKISNNDNSSIPYLVKVIHPDLNIRKGPGTSYSIVEAIKDLGVYTIVEESGGWGRLKSGAGWISLVYTERL